MDSIEISFNKIAQEYDAGRRQFIPCFDGFYGGATAFLARAVEKPKLICDLGAGTGLLSAFWLKEFPRAQFVLVDVAEEMLAVARRRFAGLSNVSFVRADYAAALPAQKFDAVVSALSIHHLEDGQKRELFSRIFSVLPDGGLFANYDQFRADTPEIGRTFDSCWERQLAESGLSDRDIALWKERRAFDRECSVEAELAMLRACGFLAECVYSCQKFAVVMAVKAPAAGGPKDRRKA